MLVHHRQSLLRNVCSSAVNTSPSDARSKISLQRRETACVGRAVGAFWAAGLRAASRVPGFPLSASLEKTTAPEASEHLVVEAQMTCPAIGPTAAKSRGSSETMARNSAFVGHSESGSLSICPGPMRLFVSAALGNSTATNSTATSDWWAAAASRY